MSKEKMLITVFIVIGLLIMVSFSSIQIAAHVCKLDEYRELAIIFYVLCLIVASAFIVIISLFGVLV